MSPELEHGVVLSSDVTLLTTELRPVLETPSKLVASVMELMATATSARCARSLVRFMMLG